MKKYKKIYTGTSIIVNRLAFLLKEIHIPYIIKDNKESARLAGFGAMEGSTELFVLDNHTKNANEIVEKFEKEVLK
ncbi:putative signal transducing protein [Aquimarina sp. M1]